LVLAIAIAANIAAHLHRTAPAVVAPDILRQLALSPAFLAAVTSAYFLAATLSQVPAGVLFDRLGLSRTVPALLVLGALGALVFATATTGTALVVGRILSGVGCGTLIMGSVVLCAQIARPERFPMLVGLILATGQIGNVLSTAPMALLSAAIGWRGSFLFLALITLLLAALYLAAARSGPRAPRAAAETLTESLLASWRILVDRRLWPVFAMAFVGYSAIFCLLGPWGGVYFDAVFGLDVIARGNALFLMALGFASGLYIFGWLHRWLGSAKAAVLVGAGLTLACFAVLAIMPSPGAGLATAILAVVGLSGGFCANIITHGRLFYLPDQIGRGVTVMNTVVLGGATVVQAWSGFVVAVGQSAYPDEPHAAFRILFAALAVWVAIGLWIYRKAETSPGATLNSLNV
jgi:predicted MFS family arabinose efflux permease